MQLQTAPPSFLLPPLQPTYLRIDHLVHPIVYLLDVFFEHIADVVAAADGEDYGGTALEYVAPQVVDLAVGNTAECIYELQQLLYLNCAGEYVSLYDISGGLL